MAKLYWPDATDLYKQQLEAYRVMPDSDLFKITEVRLTVPEQDLPGRPLKRVQCVQCGDWVQDCREVQVDGQSVCKSCAHGRYYCLV